MRGSAAFRAAVAPGGVLAGPWVRNDLWRRARAVPSLDLRFAENKSLVDATTGSNLVTFTRASSGTYVGSDGLIKTATTNLLLRSEEFGTAWSQYLVTSLTTNSTIAPNGTLTGDTVEYSADAFADINQGAAFIINGMTYTLSVWARAVSGASRFRFKYWNGSVGAYSSAIDVSETWQRYAYTFTATAASAGANVGFANTSAATRSVVFWGAQLEQSSTVGEYIPTTSTINSAPRFDHNPTTGESLGLLVEEQRTNLQTYSVPTAANWNAYVQSGATAPTVTYNNATAPDGTLTAARVVTSGTTASQVSVVVAPGVGLTATAHTGSVYLKGAVGGEVVPIIVEDNSTFTVQTCTLTTSWQRFSVTGTRSATTNYFVFGGWANFTGATSACTYYIWGAQLEAGAFPTSYIPTTTATVTRSADVASITGTNFSSWYRQEEGTVFAEGSTAWASGNFVGSSDNTNNNRIFIGVASGPASRLLITTSGSAVVSVTVPYVLNTLVRGAGGYKENSSQYAANGVLGTEDTSCAIPTVNKLSVGSNTTSSDFFLNGTIRRLTYWPQRLPNSTLQEITR